MEKLNNLYKGAGVGKTAAIIGVTSPNSFRRLSIKNICLKLYQNYLKNHVGYDKVYIIATSDKVQKVNEDYFDATTIVFGINKENLFNELGIDDIFCKQHALIFFGGNLPDSYFAICNRLTEWYKVHGNGHYYTIQDDPDFLTINPAKLVDFRVDGTRARLSLEKLGKPYNYIESEQSKLYVEYDPSNLLHECFNNTIIAHCGNDYETFFNKATQVRLGTPNVITEPKYWDTFNIYNWQGVNDNLDAKLVDYSWEDKKYVSEYHGYVKHDKWRVETTLAFYNALNNKVMLIEGKGGFSDKFNDADHLKEVEYNKLFETLATNAYSSFIIANRSTFDDFISPRYFDLMLSDIIPFVYSEYDSKKIYTDNEELKSFMYVSTPEEFAEKVNKISTDKEYYKHIKYLQRKSIYDNFGSYMSDESKNKFKNFLNL